MRVLPAAEDVTGMLPYGAIEALVLALGLLAGWCFAMESRALRFVLIPPCEYMP
jgi:hypothetical protein